MPRRSCGRQSRLRKDARRKRGGAHAIRAKLKNGVCKDRNSGRRVGGECEEIAGMCKKVQGVEGRRVVLGSSRARRVAIIGTKAAGVREEYK